MCSYCKKTTIKKRLICILSKGEAHEGPTQFRKNDLKTLNRLTYVFTSFFSYVLSSRTKKLSSHLKYNS